MIKNWEFGEFSMTRYELQTNDSIDKLQRHQWIRARNDTSASTSFWSRHSCSCNLSQPGKRWNQWHHLQWLCLSHAQGIPAGRQATVTQWIEQNLPLCRGWDQQTSKYWNGKTCLHQYGRDHQSLPRQADAVRRSILNKSSWRPVWRSHGAAGVFRSSSAIAALRPVFSIVAW